MSTRFLERQEFSDYKRLTAQVDGTRLMEFGVGNGNSEDVRRGWEKVKRVKGPLYTKTTLKVLISGRRTDRILKVISRIGS